MGLVHTCNNYGYMQAHTKDMREKEYLFSNNMICGKSSQWSWQIWIRKINGTAKFGFGKSCHDVTCSIKLLILYTTHIILHIEHNIFHIIHPYAMRPSNHGLNIKTFLKCGLNIWDIN